MIHNDTDRQTTVDTEHLRLLSIFHFVAAGLGFMGVAFSSMYLVMFQVILSNPRMWEKSQQGPPPEMFIGFFRVFIAIFVVWFLVAAIGNLMSGLFIRKSRHRTFTMVMAGINCLHIPLGTALGIMTFIVMVRESVRQRYDQSARPEMI